MLEAMKYFKGFFNMAWCGRYEINSEVNHRSYFQPFALLPFNPKIHLSLSYG